MSRQSTALCVLFALILPCAGCAPFAFNRVAVSPDGKTLYMSLNADGGLEVDESSCLYALDMEKGRLKALSGESAPQGWYSISSDGRRLVFLEGDAVKMSVKMMDLDSREVVRLTPPDQVAGLPEFVPGDKGYVIVFGGRMEEEKDKSHFVAYRGGKQFELFSGDKESPAFLPAVARDRAVMTTVKVLEEPAGEKPGKGELRLYLIDLSGDAPGKPVQIGRWEIAGSDAICFATLSPDGERITVGLRTEENKSLSLLDVDPRNARPPRTLIKEADFFPLASTPDGKGIIGFGIGITGISQIMAWSEGEEKPRLLADLGGSIVSWPTISWAGPHRLRIIAGCKDGLRIIETNLDGTHAEAKVLSWKKLSVQRHLADIEWTIDHADRVAAKKTVKKLVEPKTAIRGPDLLTEEQRTEVRTAVGPLYDLLMARDAELAKLLEAEWDKVDDWEKVLVLPEPAPAPAK